MHVLVRSCLNCTGVDPQLKSLQHIVNLQACSISKSKGYEENDLREQNSFISRLTCTDTVAMVPILLS